MSDLTFNEKMVIQLMRNRAAGLHPQSNKEIAERFAVSEVYVSDIIRGRRSGKKAEEWRNRFADYAGMEV